MTKQEKIIEAKEGLIFQNHRPIKLRNIETNNGWLPYTNEKLPKNKDYHVMNKKGDMAVLSSNVLNSLSEANLINITHYQEVIKPEKPIY